MKLRIRFTKTGPVKFIGHLDTMRFFQRALRRARFDLAYSQGFSPHPIMTFASPLGVGMESDSEILDLEVVSVTDSENMKNKLNSTMCSGIVIRDIRLLPDDAPNAMASVKAALYTVNFAEGYKPEVDIQSSVDRLLAADECFITKKTKKNELQVDIRPGIYDISYDSSGIHMKVDASSGGNIRPEQVMSVLFDSQEGSFDKSLIRIRRNEIYSTDENGELKELILFGEEF